LPVVLVLLSAGITASFVSGGQLVFRNSRVAVTVPESWSATNEPLDYSSNPVQRFVLSSYRVPRGRPNGDGDYSVPRSQVLAQLMEEQAPLPVSDGFPPRPARFALPRLTGRLEGHSGKWGEITFREHGRDFYIFLGIGSNAEARVGELLQALDAMTIAPAS
jgi:hypothetical protein